MARGVPTAVRAQVILEDAIRKQGPTCYRCRTPLVLPSEFEEGQCRHCSDPEVVDLAFERWLRSQKSNGDFFGGDAA